MRYMMLLVALSVVLPLFASPANALCGAFVVYNSGPYSHYFKGYRDLPKNDYRTWAWNARTAEEAMDLAKKECLKMWKREKPTLAPQPAGKPDAGGWICREVYGVFCTEAHNRCGALVEADDHITWSTYRTGPTSVYFFGAGSSKYTAEQNALQNCRAPNRHLSNPIQNCRVVGAACNHS